MPTLSYFLATLRHPIDDKHALWNQPLPADRRGTASAEPGVPEGEILTYGGYFSAVARFCSHSGWRNILRVTTDKLQQPLTVDHIAGASIFLEKHGALYHPARVEVTVAGQRFNLVVNVASSPAGKAALVRETRALAHLNEHRPFGWFPSVFAVTAEPPPMFLGDWFDDYHEFHLTRTSRRDELGLVLWDGAAKRCLLSKNQAAALYRNMAMILTACYDPVSTRQIFPWHHAAGDFVVRLRKGRVSVKLITVRGYTPLTNDAARPADENELLESLLLFFLHLSVRMRLDRLDGVSDVAWAPDSCLVPTVDGFFQGLDLAARMSGFPEAFPQIFQQYLRHQRAGDLESIAAQLIHTVFDGHSEEIRVIESVLAAHIKAVFARLTA